jgi:hypothetical protein
MRLECKHVWPYLSEFIDNTVSPEERAAIQLHLEHCEICSAILDSVHNILVLSADDRVFRLPVGFDQRLHARLEAEMRKISPAGEEDVTPADDEG